jgi:CRISPR/Cas system-associated exonuclease Cas4 (RecB family)
LQCPKLLWCRYNAPQLLPPVDSLTQSTFDQGHQVGLLARALYSGGLAVVDSQSDPQQALKETRKAVLERRPLFEPAFTCAGSLARIDILNPIGRDDWELVEVKSGVEMKDINLQDVAFQAFVLTGSGLKVRRCTLMHLDRNYVRHGALDPERLFVRRDVTPQAMELSRSIEDGLEEIQKTVGRRTCPEKAIGAHCDAPFPCPLRDYCWAFLPEHSVLDLYRGKKRGFDLLNRGFTRISEIPESEPLTAIQRVQKQSILDGRPHTEQEPFRRFLKHIRFPAYFLDFETFQMALPPYEGTRPWQQIPFQFSLHVLPALGAEPEHHMFLAEGGQDPRPQFLGRLRELLGSAGSVVAYNAQFEKRVLRDCCDVLPDCADWLREIEKRFVDLLIPFKAFRYYHPEQRGSASMKAVLPALVGDTYDSLEIQEGGTASLEFCRVTFGNVSEAEKARVRRNLEVYCSQDTMGMVKIVRALRGLCAR